MMAVTPSRLGTLGLSLYFTQCLLLPFEIMLLVSWKAAEPGNRGFQNAQEKSHHC